MKWVWGWRRGSRKRAQSEQETKVAQSRSARACATPADLNPLKPGLNSGSEPGLSSVLASLGVGLTLRLVPRDLLCVSSVSLWGVSWILEGGWGYNSVTHDLRLGTGIYRGDNSQSSLISDPGDMGTGGGGTWPLKTGLLSPFDKWRN